MLYRQAHQILGVSEDSSLEEIKTAYRQKALTFHPDRGGDPEKFREATEAKNVAISYIGIKANDPPIQKTTTYKAQAGSQSDPIGVQDKTVQDIIAKLVARKITFDVTVLYDETVISRGGYRIISVDHDGNIIVQVWRWDVNDTITFYKNSEYKANVVIDEFLEP